MLKCIIAIGLPVLPILSWGGSFNNDWINNIWQIGYYGEYFRAHFSFPAAYNTASYVGMVYPTFYAYLLYPLLGLFSAVLGPILTLKSCSVLVLFIQYWLNSKLFSKVTQSHWNGFVIAILINWSIYPLTNLYHRSAIPEFFATHFLFIAISSLSIAYFSENIREKSLFVGVAVFSMLLTLGSHPITAMFGTPIFLLLIYLYRMEIKQYRLRMVTLSCLSLMILSPWLYATAHFLKSLNHLPKFLLQTEAFDAFWVRFFPLPLDLNQVSKGVDLSTPFLDAQINFPILFLTLSLLILNKLRGFKIYSGVRTLCVVSLTIAFFIALVSLDMPGGNRIAQFFTPILYYVQYAYRLTTYINLFLVLALMGLLYRTQVAIHSLLLMAICMGGVAVVSKVQRGFAVTRFDHLDQRVASNLTEMPETVYGANDFIVSAEITEFLGSLQSVKRIWLPVSKSWEFGTAHPKDFELEKKSWVSFNIYPFPWNKIKVDGNFVESANLVVMKYGHWVNERLLSNPSKENGQSEYHLGLFLGAGKHQVEYVFAPNRTWVGLRWLSVVAGFILVLGILFSLWRDSKVFLVPKMNMERVPA